MRKGTAKKVVKTSDDGSTEDAVVAMSLRPPKKLYDRLRLLAFDKRVPMTTLVERGIEMVLKAEKY